MDMTYKLRQFQTANVTLQIFIVDLAQEGTLLQDRWVPVEDHQAGQTVQIPHHLQDRAPHKYYVGQTTPAELSASYAKQGRANPSLTAYQSLQEELAYDLTAGEYALECRVIVNGIPLARATPSVVFDYSMLYSAESLTQRATECLNEIGREFVFEALQAARDKLTTLKNVI